MRWPWSHDIDQLQAEVKRLMATQADLATAINAAADRITAAVAKVQAALAASGNTSPEVDAALQALTAQIGALEALAP